MTTSRPLAATLDAFSHHQLSGLRAGDITGVTSHLILATAFFTGATIRLAAAGRQPKSAYLPVLRRFLASTFGLDEDRAAGLVESNARLYKRYRLIDRIYHDGWHTAQHWLQDAAATPPALKTLLAELHDLSMSNLNVEGVKEEQSAPAEVEAIAREQPAPTTVAPPPRRTASKTIWLLPLAALAAAGYFALYPERIPPALLDAITSLLPD